MIRPNLLEEKKLWRRGYKFVACVDEAGRGPLAGPVVAAAVALLPISNSKFLISKQFKKLKDSKQLSPKRREEIYRKIQKHLFESEDSSDVRLEDSVPRESERPLIQWGIGIVSEKIIDKINIFQATRLAMERAFNNLKFNNCKSFVHIIIDGTMLLNTNVSQTAIVKGDEKVFSCALASIVAKVTRDRIMVRYHKKYPQYGFARHKGYGTPHHMKMLKKYGPCLIHRRSFAPISSIKILNPKS